MLNILLNFSELQKNIDQFRIHIIGFQKRGKSSKRLEKVITEYIQNLLQSIKTSVKEVMGEN